MRIVLGSDNAHKLDAVHQACEKIGLQAEISGRKTRSGQNEQPVGLEATFKGAFARANNAMCLDDYKDAIFIGIESGIIPMGQFSWISSVDMAVIVVLFGNSHRFITATSSGIQLPLDCLSAANLSGFATTTVGSVIAKKIGGDATDPHSTLTKGAVSRRDTLVQALVMALSQI